MYIRDLKIHHDEMAARRSRVRDFSKRVRAFNFLNFKTQGETYMDKAEIAKKAAARAAEIRAKKKPSIITNAAKKKTGKYDRNAVFTCSLCKPNKTITGPWSFKQHLMKQHGKTAEQVGLNPRGKKAKK